MRNVERELIKHICKSSCQTAVFLLRFTLNLNFPDRRSKNVQISRVTKFRPVGAELFHVCRRTDTHDEASTSFPQIDAPNKEPFVSIFNQTQKVSITQVGNLA